MRRHFDLCIALFLGTWLAAGVAAAALPQPVARALASGGIPESSVAVYVHEIGAARPVLAHGAERSLNPASSMKLVTTFAALDLLGPAHVWETEVYATGPMKGDVLHGDLVIRGSGDPKLTLESFWMLLRGLRARGVREIQGDLVLDRTLFAAADFDPAAFDGEPTRPYNTGPDALLVNYKAVTIHLVPEVEGRTVRVIADPLVPQLQVVNHLSLTDTPCGDWVSRLKLDVEGTNDAAQLTFAGTYSSDCGERSRSFSLLGHREYVAGLFIQLWRDLGGTLGGSVRDGETPPHARLVLVHRSPTLAEVVRDVNKFSNNVMSRQLFLTLAAARGGAPATLARASAVVHEWLKTRGLAIPELVIENGSGLSRVERISARSLGELLIEAFRSPVMPELVASLPLAAADGTMRKRLKTADVAGQAHIKTGSLVGVRSIAGYVLDGRGRRVVVVFIVNHPNAGASQAAQDALLRWVHRR
jgi:serine-type D-Ala-D-Ala carboxypeptidase/endopeptidase (penicillin-binding protein 4)